jgi:hypothetical protein
MGRVQNRPPWPGGLDNVFEALYLTAVLFLKAQQLLHMKKILCLFALAALVSQAGAQMPTQEEMDKAMAAYRTPGEVHKMMSAWNGTWDCEVTMFMDPSAPPMKSKGTMKSRMLLDGRYNEMQYSGTYGNEPMKGISLTAWDNVKKLFVNTWIDNFGTGVMVLEGPWDEATQSMTLTGKMTNPMGGPDVQVRQVLSLPNANTQKMEMWVNMGGGEMKTMEMNMKKSGK